MPEGLQEHILAEAYGWTLEYIRRLSDSDFRKQLGICLVRRRIETAKMEQKQFMAAAQQRLGQKFGGKK